MAVKAIKNRDSDISENLQNKLFPYSFSLDKKLTIINQGPALKKLLSSYKINKENFNEIFSFRYGFDLEYSFAYDKVQKIPMMEKEISDDGNLFYMWKWNDEPESPDWCYPLSVDGHVFSRKELFLMCNNISFNTPNSLEANLQVFVDFYKYRHGIMYDKVKLVNVPCNLVQNEFCNRSTGYYSSKELLLVWKQGKRINVDDFFNLSAKDAMYKKYSFYDLF